MQSEVVTLNLASVKNEVKKLFQTISKIITERDDGLRQLMTKRLKSQGEIGKYI